MITFAWCLCLLIYPKFCFGNEKSFVVYIQIDVLVFLVQYSLNCLIHTPLWCSLRSFIYIFFSLILEFWYRLVMRIKIYLQILATRITWAGENFVNLLLTEFQIFGTFRNLLNFILLPFLKPRENWFFFKQKSISDFWDLSYSTKYKLIEK